MKLPEDPGRLAVRADPTRTRILRLILDADEGRMLVGRLADELGLRQPTVSHHMKALLAQGFVTREPDGRRAWYAIHPAHIDRLTQVLMPPATGAAVDLVRIADDLATRYRGTFGRETVDRVVQESHSLLRRTSSGFLLASRTSAFSASRLDAVAAASITERVPAVLFVCVQNAGRSQIAAAILRHLAGPRVEVRTAGSAPSGDVRAAVVAALDEIGVGTGGEFPKPLTDDVVRAADVVITMGCGDACPVYPGRRYLDWDIADPTGRSARDVRPIRDDIDRRVRGLLPELSPR